MNVFRGDAGNGTTAQSWVPPLDVWETEGDVVYAFDLPGLSQDTINVEVEDGALTVSATRKRELKQEGDKFYRFERRFGTFSRSIGPAATPSVSRTREGRGHSAPAFPPPLDPLAAPPPPAGAGDDA